MAVSLVVLSLLVAGFVSAVRNTSVTHRYGGRRIVNATELLAEADRSFLRSISREDAAVADGARCFLAGSARSATSACGCAVARWCTSGVTATGRGTTWPWTPKRRTAKPVWSAPTRRSTPVGSSTPARCCRAPTGAGRLPRRA
ncbi:MAG: hypothetical protein ACRDY5_04475 [Acidimicrobiales bacterium]